VRTLLIAATGGHLAELVKLRERLPLEEAPTWVTFKSEQADTLLRGERVLHVHEVNPRGYVNLARNLPIAHRVIRSGEFVRAISNGAGIALAFLPLARAHGLEAHYIENAARVEGPSLTGRLLELVPGVRLYAQYERLARGRWRYAGSIFDAFEPASAPRRGDPLRIAVTVGTLPYSFRRLIERLLAILPKDAEVVLWQTGWTPLDGLGVDGRRLVPPSDLSMALQAADVVVQHGGIGSALQALEAGKRPVMVPRRERFGEHVDDHQEQVARELARRGLALMRHVDDLHTEDILQAAELGVRAVAVPPPLVLA